MKTLAVNALWSKHTLESDNMQFYALISCILCISSLKYNHICMLSWFKMIKMIILCLKECSWFFINEQHFKSIWWNLFSKKERKKERKSRSPPSHSLFFFLSFSLFRALLCLPCSLLSLSLSPEFSSSPSLLLFPAHVCTRKGEREISSLSL